MAADTMCREHSLECKTHTYILETEKRGKIHTKLQSYCFQRNACAMDRMPNGRKCVARLKHERSCTFVEGFECSEYSLVLSSTMNILRDRQSWAARHTCVHSSISNTWHEELIAVKLDTFVEALDTLSVSI
jgi:hypothetical protein